MLNKSNTKKKDRQREREPNVIIKEFKKKFSRSL